MHTEEELPDVMQLQIRELSYGKWDEEKNSFWFEEELTLKGW